MPVPKGYVWSDRAMQSFRKKARPAEERFWENVWPEPNSGCWLWTGAARPKGYGMISVDRRMRSATHISLKIHGIEVPTGKYALHSCDNPWCVNPGHLFVGTQKDNIADCICKGRAPYQMNPQRHKESLARAREALIKEPWRHARGARHGAYTRPDRVRRGEMCGRAKLTEVMVQEIRSSTLSNVALAEKFGVSDSAIWFARNRRTWRSVP